MVANTLPADPRAQFQGVASAQLRGGGGGQNSTFSEHGHVAYEIKGNHECSNMVANILPADPTGLDKQHFLCVKL